ncbi:vWA domain-containing protein [Geodermatophilus sp. SYSU D00779]
MITSADTRVLFVGATAALAPDRVGLASGAATGPAVFRLLGRGPERRWAVERFVHSDIPAGRLVVGEAMREQLGLTDDAEWEMHPAEAVPIRRLVLELPTERQRPETVAQSVARAGLVGRLLWLSGAEGEAWLDVDDVPFRVLTADTGGRQDVVAEITQSTVVELFAPGVKAGVDMVILADCSGSMGVDDIPVGPESPEVLRGVGYLQRMEALRRALYDLLDVRLRVAGRISRVALIEFNQRTAMRFPRSGGMAELDASSDQEVIREFREGIALLRADGGTNIGNALHAAADLLYQHGHPGNERLCVLVSDGADWRPRGEQGTGEVVTGVDEPVSLMAHLHRDMGIRLHAIGISTRELFLRRYRDQEGLTPNHELLVELVKVGGGDPATIGGLDVLVEYFSGVGSGITHRVREAMTRRRADFIVDAEVAGRLRHAATSSSTGRLGDLVNDLHNTFNELNAASERVFPQRPLRTPEVRRAFVEISKFQEDGGSARDRLTTALRSLKRSVALPEDAQTPAVRSWSHWLRTMADALPQQGDDLGRLPEVVQADPRDPVAVVAGVATRLLACLEEILRETATLPDRAQATAPVGAPPTIQDEAPVQGFVYKE